MTRWLPLSRRGGGRAARRADAILARERQLWRMLVETAVTGHIVDGTPRGVRACIRRDARVGLLAEHGRAARKAQEMRVHGKRDENSSGGEEVLLERDTEATVRLAKCEGPFKSDKFRDDGKPANDYVKLFFAVSPQQGGGEFSQFADHYIGPGNRTRRIFEAFLGRDLADDEDLDWPDIVGKTARVIAGEPKDGLYTRIAVWLRLPKNARMPQQAAVAASSPNRRPQRPASAATATVDAGEDEDAPF